MNIEVAWDAEVTYNDETDHWELYVFGEGVRYMSYDEDEVYKWAEVNGYTTEETWGDPAFGEC